MEAANARRPVIRWLLDSDEPWTRYRTLVDLVEHPESDPQVAANRTQILDHPRVREFIAEVARWPGHTLKRHNDASHPLHALAALGDFGIRARDPGVSPAIDAIMAHQSDDGALQVLLNISKAFGGSGEDGWSWVACDAPVHLYALLAMECGDNPRGRLLCRQ
ncbi:MAG: hypothetical protein GX620_13610 [Chloroflexi bacterium]|nr:hypothetical protein [Chloroflexota bacterium]